MKPSEVLRRAREIYEMIVSVDSSGNWGRWAIAQACSPFLRDKPKLGREDFQRAEWFFTKADQSFDRAIALAEAKE